MSSSLAFDDRSASHVCIDMCKSGYIGVGKNTYDLFCICLYVCLSGYMQICMDGPN